MKIDTHEDGDRQEDTPLVPQDPILPTTDTPARLRTIQPTTHKKASKGDKIRHPDDLQSKDQGSPIGEYNPHPPPTTQKQRTRKPPRPHRMQPPPPGRISQGLQKQRNTLAKRRETMRRKLLAKTRQHPLSQFWPSIVPHSLPLRLHSLTPKQELQPHNLHNLGWKPHTGTPTHGEHPLDGNPDSPPRPPPPRIMRLGTFLQAQHPPRAHLMPPNHTSSGIRKQGA